jgi:putative transposase
MSEPRAKEHRLDLRAYSGVRNTVLTACVHERRQVFTSNEIVESILSHLEKTLEVFECSAPVYCFMPDHLHLMIHGQTDSSSAVKAMTSFKTITGRWYQQNVGQRLWQKSFYDHIVRDYEDWKKQLLYIYSNPVRAGLVLDPRDYPFSGAIGHDIAAVLSE